MVAKWLTVFAAIVAVLGLFLPMAVHEDEELVAALEELTEEEIPNASAFSILTGSSDSLSDDEQLGIIVMSAPVGVLLLLGILGVFIRYGRILAVVVLLIGLAGGGLNFLFVSELQDAADVDAGIGALLMLGGLGLGGLAGLIGLIKPQEED